MRESGVSTPHANLPNLITAARIIACPVIFWLAIAPGVGARFAAFVLFVIKHPWITAAATVLALGAFGHHVGMLPLAAGGT